MFCNTSFPQRICRPSFTNVLSMCLFIEVTFHVHISFIYMTFYHLTTYQSLVQRALTGLGKYPRALGNNSAERNLLAGSIQNVVGISQ